MRAEAQLEDMLFSLGQQKNDVFPQIQNIRTYDDSIEPNSDNSLVTIFLRYDQRYFIYQRKAYSIMEFLGDVGGL